MVAGSEWLAASACFFPNDDENEEPAIRHTSDASARGRLSSARREDCGEGGHASVVRVTVKIRWLRSPTLRLRSGQTPSNGALGGEALVYTQPERVGQPQWSRCGRK